MLLYPWSSQVAGCGSWLPIPGLPALHSDHRSPVALTRLITSSRRCQVLTTQSACGANVDEGKVSGSRGAVGSLGLITVDSRRRPD
jgi:hypothetical protein